MQTIVVILVALVRAIVLSRTTLPLENIALRLQVAVPKRERPRPLLGPLDGVFWVFLSRLWPRWKGALRPPATWRISARLVTADNAEHYRRTPLS